MNCYRVNVRKRSDEDYCFIERPPDQIALLSSYIMSGDAAMDQYPSDVVAKMCPKTGGIVLSDFIGNAELSLICSARVKEVVESVCGKGCEYLPVSIQNHRGRIASAEYFYINPLGLQDCLNHKFSEVDYNSDGKVICVDKFVIDKKNIPTLPPLFRLKENDSMYFIQQNLVDAIREQIKDVSNFNLEPIEVA